MPSGNDTALFAEQLAQSAADISNLGAGESDKIPQSSRDEVLLPQTSATQTTAPDLTTQSQELAEPLTSAQQAAEDEAIQDGLLALTAPPEPEPPPHSAAPAPLPISHSNMVQAEQPELKEANLPEVPKVASPTQNTEVPRNAEEAKAKEARTIVDPPSDLPRAQESATSVPQPALSPRHEAEPSARPSQPAQSVSDKSLDSHRAGSYPDSWTLEPGRTADPPSLRQSARSTNQLQYTNTRTTLPLGEPPARSQQRGTVPVATALSVAEPELDEPKVLSGPSHAPSAELAKRVTVFAAALLPQPAGIAPGSGTGVRQTESPLGPAQSEIVIPANFTDRTKSETAPVGFGAPIVEVSDVAVTQETERASGAPLQTAPVPSKPAGTSDYFSPQRAKTDRVRLSNPLSGAPTVRWKPVPANLNPTRNTSRNTVSETGPLWGMDGTPATGTTAAPVAWLNETQPRVTESKSEPFPSRVDRKVEFNGPTGPTVSHDQPAPPEAANLASGPRTAELKTTPLSGSANVPQPKTRRVPQAASVVVGLREASAPFHLSHPVWVAPTPRTDNSVNPHPEPVSEPSAQSPGWPSRLQTRADSDAVERARPAQVPSQPLAFAATIRPVSDRIEPPSAQAEFAAQMMAPTSSDDNEEVLVATALPDQQLMAPEPRTPPRSLRFPARANPAGGTQPEAPLSEASTATPIQVASARDSISHVRPKSVVPSNFEEETKPLERKPANANAGRNDSPFERQAWPSTETNSAYPSAEPTVGRPHEARQESPVFTSGSSRVASEEMDTHQVPNSPKTLSLQLSEESGEKVNVRLTQRGGDMHVAVHSADDQVVRGLRQNLQDLTDRLADNGFRSDVWHASDQPSHAQPHRESNTSNYSRGDDSRGQSGYSQQEQSRERRDSQQGRPQWFVDMEEDLHSNKSDSGKR